MSLGGRKRGWVGGEALQYNEHTIIWGIRDSKWQDKSNQNAETIEAERMKKRQAIPVLLTDCLHWSHHTV